MRDYVCRWEDSIKNEMPVSEVPTPIIVLMIDHVMRGRPVYFRDGENLDGVLERLRIELCIRAWGMSE
jgi:hypothetical protein